MGKVNLYNISENKEKTLCELNLEKILYNEKEKLTYIRIEDEEIRR